ncbi:hypothetical protein GJW-30_1_03344 [Variibacter gotjawalensis]|uniref:YqaE/Pmp3 family membrane protein n=1 Tax=Variibacter gotjawalensis TaxID=1333996 RepID=A0A0S3PXX3_9BRAD|nr:hypothetical protein [Variibacter gotjawalensis]NIK46629.1 hypothetical protein [Variibacter gotjawalensis]RZS48532.1 hypothetical protein EV661_0947 [Variibacter gotjawalensis]BAT60794.1 hypothetical protein GJW-30_1_03344 [Variibacter gotjawalensis]
MIYVLAFFLPPVALLLNGQPFHAILSAIVWVVCLVFSILLLSPGLMLVSSAHAIIAISMRRGERRHREVVDAINRTGQPPPGYRP